MLNDVSAGTGEVIPKALGVPIFTEGRGGGTGRLGKNEFVKIL